VAVVAAGRLLLLLLAGAVLGGAAVPSANDLAGRWTRRFTSGDITGARFPVEDELVIVATDPTHAVFDLQLNFFNGHVCSIGGAATLEGGRLVYNNAQTTGYDGSACRLVIWRDGNRIRWDDGEATCQGFCGARGGLRGGELRWSTRRAITRAEQARIIANERRNRSLP
jgi:hypothetical protein